MQIKSSYGAVIDLFECTKSYGILIYFDCCLQLEWFDAN